MKYLSLWEFVKKQDYIFKSNKLIEVVGASLIIKNLTEDFREYNLKEENFIIKKGGKALYKFDTLEEAKKFNKDFSINMLKDYPGLEVFMITKEYDENNDDVREIIKNIYELLEIKKSSRKNSTHQVAFGIERPCQSTALPACKCIIEGGIRKYYSKEIEKKINFARQHQENNFENLIPKGYELEKVIEKLVNEEEKSYISIIHIDGNSMGKKFKMLKNKISPKCGEGKEEFNERYIKVLNKFSEEVSNAYEEAFKYTMDVIEKNKNKLNKVTKMQDGYFPVRPLILAGDDITYISNAYIGIESAIIFIEELSKKNLTIEGINLGNLNACAGVSVIKKNYPFIKGYELAEDLCQNAKKVLVEKGDNSLTVIDFQIVQGEIVGNIDYIRNKDYSLPNKPQILTMRPLIVNNEEEWRNYNNFIESLDRLNDALNNKNIGRNKIKALRSEIKKGKEATEHFIKFYSIDANRYLPTLQGAMGDYCFNIKDNDRCMYLDGIEVMDLFIKLDR